MLIYIYISSWYIYIYIYIYISCWYIYIMLIYISCLYDTQMTMRCSQRIWRSSPAPVLSPWCVRWDWLTVSLYLILSPGRTLTLSVPARWPHSLITLTFSQPSVCCTCLIHLYISIIHLSSYFLFSFLLPYFIHWSCYDGSYVLYCAHTSFIEVVMMGVMYCIVPMQLCIVLCPYSALFVDLQRKQKEEN